LLELDIDQKMSAPASKPVWSYHSTVTNLNAGVQTDLVRGGQDLITQIKWPATGRTVQYACIPVGGVKDAVQFDIWFHDQVQTVFKVQPFGEDKLRLNIKDYGQYPNKGGLKPEDYINVVTRKLWPANMQK
jgi:hypothetical protein